MEEKKMTDFNERVAERMISGIATAAIVAFGLIAVGTAAAHTQIYKRKEGNIWLMEILTVPS